MPQSQKLSAAPRDAKATRVRHAGQIPAVLYGHMLTSQNISVEVRAFNKVYAAAGATTLVDLDLNGTTHNVLIRDVQHHPVRDHVLHIDFYQVRLDEELEADVPLHFMGEAPAVKDLGGVFVRNRDTVAVKSLPKDLPAHIEVNVGTLAQFNDVIHVSDLAVPEGVTVLADADDVIALIQAPRSDAELEALKEEVKEDVESIEVTTEKKEEPEEGAEGTAAAPEEKKADEAK